MTQSGTLPVDDGFGRSNNDLEFLSNHIDVSAHLKDFVFKSYFPISRNNQYCYANNNDVQYSLIKVF